MQKIEQLFHHIFIDGLNGMANGLYVTLVLGTILAEIGTILGGSTGNMINIIGTSAISMTSIGIGIGVAAIYQESMLVILASAVAAFAGGNAAAIIDGTLLANGSIVLGSNQEPLGAFLAALFACFAGHLLSKKTKIDMILTPVVSIVLGSAVGLVASPGITRLYGKFQELTEWASFEQLLVMSAVIGIVFGLCSVLPLNTVSLCVLLGLDGYMAGAATIGICSTMIGLAVTGFADNGIPGFFVTAFGTPKLQLPNFLRHPQIIIPSLIAAGICSPLGVILGGLMNTAAGAGMGCLGFAGEITTFAAMSVTGEDGRITLVKLLLFHFILPGLLAGVATSSLRRCNIIPAGIAQIRNEAA